MSFPGSTSAISKEARILALKRGFDEVIHRFFEDLRLLHFRAKNLVEFELLRWSSRSKLGRNERHLRIELVDSKVRIVIIVDIICGTYSQDGLNGICKLKRYG